MAASPGVIMHGPNAGESCLETKKLEILKGTGTTRIGIWAKKSEFILKDKMFAVPGGSVS